MLSALVGLYAHAAGSPLRRLSTVRRADLIAVVEGGQIVEAGSREQLLALPDGIFKRLVSTAELGWVEGGLPSSSSNNKGVGAAAGKHAQAVPAAR